MSQPKAISPEVFVAQDRLVTVDLKDVAVLDEAAARAPRHRARLCAHKDRQDRIHEMFIVLTRDVYIRPHRHVGKSESFHVIEGTATVVFFEDGGRVEEVVRIGDYHSGRPFYYRIDDARFHTQVVTSDRLVVHETTGGPFDPSDTEFAPWSPEESDPLLTTEYVDRLNKELAELK